MSRVSPPESNADNVALNLVIHATDMDTLKPGDSIAELFERMAVIARNIAGDFKASRADWNGVLAEGDLSEVEKLGRRQVDTAGDVWAQEWMLTMMAKHLHEILEDRCLCENNIPNLIQSIDYDDDGRVKSWKMRDGTFK